MLIRHPHAAAFSIAVWKKNGSYWLEKLLSTGQTLRLAGLIMLICSGGASWPEPAALGFAGMAAVFGILGYATLTAHADSMLFAAGDALPMHEFHHWDSTANGSDFTAAKSNGRSWACGFANAHLYAGFPHLYWAGTPLPRRFVDAACHYKKETP